MQIVPVIPTACANWTYGAPVCTSKGSAQCAGCKLVLYCGPKCQKSHWPEHKKDCRSPLSKSSWRPTWDRENRAPAWSSGDAATNIHNPYGATDKYLWGNVPAIDVLQLGRNEGSQHADKIALLFAASGDLRNVVKTISHIPESFANRVRVTINDREFEVVARNAILLLFAFTSLDQERPIPEIAEGLIHLWYSAFLPADLLSSLQSRVGTLISPVCIGIKDKATGTLHKKRWKFRSGSTLRLNLEKNEWLRLEQSLHVPEGLGFEEARKIRSATVMAPGRMDYRDRWYYKDATPSMRLAKQRFREDGLLLSFGHPRIGFDSPNPTLFQTPNSWPMDDKADPLAGWCIRDVNKMSSRATLDLYGNLFAYLRDELGKFLDRLVSVKIDFQLYCLDVRDLPPHLDHKAYNRIEVSNITDAGPAYVGTETTLGLLFPLLQTPKQNTHATIITSYLNAVMGVFKMSSQQDQIPNMDLLLEYLGKSAETLISSPQGAALYKIWDSRSLVLDRKRYFEGFMALQEFDTISTALGVTMKKTNTVIEPWPTALKLRPAQKGAQEEFDLLLASNFSGLERYVEWIWAE
ncbi:hypothetical protein K504DRAFT_395900 [Pleomassaria siparia CBS 279.74]|uniref:MYND-type domain-containing protein n=1 Tax=Pleomassaria siparia CBS 279.74 TaxID=1314801 RepID=A0A6G1KRG8_9PLEO|nr:hypothetical protein K504DRAFT_395900 [Pleomassaria siparia CBS 279.74]